MADLVFILDVSSAVSAHELRLAKLLVSTVIMGLNVGSSAVKVELLTTAQQVCTYPTSLNNLPHTHLNINKFTRRNKISTPFLVQ